jgi:Uma2 family endonuclease
MSVARGHPRGLTEFLAWEERQEFKYEFDGVAPVAMVGVTVARSEIQRNILVALGTRLRGKSCRPHGSELKIQVVGRIRYPDAFVTCTPRANAETIITDPVVIFEIISNESDHRDRITKNEEYRRTPSVQRYVMLEQDEPAAMVFAREGERWVGTLHTSDAILAMPEIGIEIPLAEFYDGLDFTPGEPLA